MNYPVWDVPVIGSGWVIGMIAIFHVLVSHFAVGGGIYFAFAEYKARKEKSKEWLSYLKGHSKFFLVLTGVYGAVTGVGIWFAIGLAHPEATSTLIHNFVFGWAIEWVFFIVELSAAAVYYYTWDKIPAKLHLKIAYLYAAASVLTLVIINGILTFMLTPGQAWLSVAGTGKEADQFWLAFFNPTYFPSLFLRLAVCCSMAGIFALVTASQIDSETLGAFKVLVVRWSTRWLFPSFLLMPIFFLWYLAVVPEESKGLLQLGMQTIGQGTFTQVTRAALVSVMGSATVLAIVYFIAYLYPKDFGTGHAFAVLFIALSATAATEYARETLRKPFVINQHMYSSGVRQNERDKFNQEGYLTHSPWVKPEEKQQWASQQPLAHADQVERGRLIFLGQCVNCHTVKGYRSMEILLGERDRKAIGSLLETLHAAKPDSPYTKFMPPLVGTVAEREALADYLSTLGTKPLSSSPLMAEHRASDPTVHK